MHIANSTLTAYQKHTRSIPEAYTEAYCIFHDILRFVWVQRPARKNCIFDYAFIKNVGQPPLLPVASSSTKIPARMWKIQYAVVYAVGMLLVCCRYAVGVLLATCITTPDRHALDAAHSSTILLMEKILQHYEAASEPGFPKFWNLIVN